MILQNVVDISMPEGNVDIIRDKNNILLWGRRRYGTKYFGDMSQSGTPTVSSPEAIKVVTGQQTISIDGTDYPLGLGTIELCKLGTFQDYIWKDGEDWKVHKKITKYVCDSTLNWTWDASVPRLSASSATLGLHVMGPINAYTAVIGKSNKFVANSFNYVYAQKNNGFAYSPSGFISCVDKEWGSESEAKADILGSIFYFVLHDGYTTDTTITETNLIAQLNAVENFITRSGYTYSISGDLPIIISRTEI